MSQPIADAEMGLELAHEYELRFADAAEDRRRVWRVLIDGYFGRLVGSDADVLDLGAGWGEFINQFPARSRHAMDLNPQTRGKLAEGVRFHEQDCSKRWALPDASLDVVFTSNFFEHLPTKASLQATLSQAARCLRPGGRIVCMGPNIRFLAAEYWDFFDHHLALSDRSLCEALRMAGFTIDRCVDRFLPYTMVGKRPPRDVVISTYLRLPWAWRWFGRQFLVVARRPAQPAGAQRIAA